MLYAALGDLMTPRGGKEPRGLAESAMQEASKFRGDARGGARHIGNRLLANTGMRREASCRPAVQERGGEND